ncbi:hypothetical protein PFISCL1PPCAC_3172, partial [Pristionchus fissidentatus]
FIQWLLELRPEFFEEIEGSLEQSGVIDQNFLEQFSNGRQGVKLILNSAEDHLELPHFTPTRQIVYTIPRYSKLCIASMVLTTEWVVELILDQLSRPDDGIERDWDFSMTVHFNHPSMA